MLIELANVKKYDIRTLNPILERRDLKHALQISFFGLKYLFNLSHNSTVTVYPNGALYMLIKFTQWKTW